jgi:hypothetical protein
MALKTNAQGERRSRAEAVSSLAQHGTDRHFLFYVAERNGPGGVYAGDLSGSTPVENRLRRPEASIIRPPYALAIVPLHTMLVEKSQYILSPDIVPGGTESPMPVLMGAAENGIDLRLEVSALVVAILAEHANWCKAVIILSL